MITTPLKKNKIHLPDYDYQKDLKNRLLMSDFSIFDVEVIEELINGSLHTTVQALAEELCVDSEEIFSVLNKLSETGLFTLDSQQITVNKEIRKYFELQIEKFDTDFRADMDYLQGLLTKVPIHLLPNWYSISKTADNIFEAICERYLSSPKVYRQYLDELELDDPIHERIAQEVFNSPNLQLPAESLIKKYHLSQEEFEVCMLHLEFNFICCLSYQIIDNQWCGVVTPFYEWRHYQLFLNSTETSSIEDESAIHKPFTESFAFVKAMNQVVEIIKEAPLAWSEEESQLSPESVGILLRQCDKHSLLEEQLHSHFNTVIIKLISLGFVTCNSGLLTFAAEAAQEWLQMETKDQAIYLYRHPCDWAERTDLPFASMRNFRQAEKSLRRVVNEDWVLFSDFIPGVIHSFSHQDPIQLKREKRRWHYALPKHGPDEQHFIYVTIFERLFQVGMVETGVIEGKECFCLTDLGRESICN